MAFTYDPLVGSPRDQVRLLIGDTDLDEPGNWIFQDEEIDSFLAMEASVVKLAAAQALDTMASSEAMILKKIRILDLTTDGPAVAKELRERASTLRDLYYDGDDQLPDTAELVLDPHTYAERLNNERLRA